MPVRKWWRGGWCCTFGFLLWLVVACGGNTLSRPLPTPLPPPTPPVLLHVGLTDDARPLHELVTSPYQQHAPNTYLTWEIGNRNTLLRALEQAEISAALLHTLPENHTFWYAPIALDGLVLAVHPSNTVRDLSREQAQAIFQGQLDTWEAIGRGTGRIAVLSREEGADTRVLLTHHVLGNGRLSMWSTVAGGRNAMHDALSANPLAIGYTTLGSISAVSPLSVNGIAPTIGTVRDQTYPFTTPIYFVSTAEPQDALRHFLAWLHAPLGQAVLGTQYGTVR